MCGLCLDNEACRYVYVCVPVPVQATVHSLVRNTMMVLTVHTTHMARKWEAAVGVPPVDDWDDAWLPDLFCWAADGRHA